MEFVELPRSVHPFFVGTQAHPELKSRPTRAHPLFSAFVAAALRHDASSRLFGPDDEAPVRDAAAVVGERDEADDVEADHAEADDVEAAADGVPVPTASR